MRKQKKVEMQKWIEVFAKDSQPVAHINILDEIREPVKPKALRMVLDLMLNRRVGDSHE